MLHREICRIDYNMLYIYLRSVFSVFGVFAEFLFLLYIISIKLTQVTLKEITKKPQRITDIKKVPVAQANISAPSEGEELVEIEGLAEKVKKSSIKRV